MSECRREEIKRSSSPWASVGEKRLKKSSLPWASVGEKRLKRPPRLQRVQARTNYKTSLRKQIEASLKALSASRGGGDVTPGQVEASGKALLTLEWVQARWNWKVRGVNDLKYGKGRLIEDAFSLEWNIDIDLVRPVEKEVKGWLGKVRRGHLTI